jgi:hypothetical protein
MPADATIQNALIVIAVALSVQTVLMLCTVIAISVAWKRAHAMVDTQLTRFGERLDDVAAQTRMAADAIERSSRQVNTILHDAGGVMRSVGTFVGTPRTLLMTGLASAASAFSRWRRARHPHQQQQHAAAR